MRKSCGDPSGMLSNPLDVFACLVQVLLKKSCGDPVRVLPKKPSAEILKVLCVILRRSSTEDLVETW